MSNYDNGFDKAQREYDMQEPPEYEQKVIGSCISCGADICEYDTHFVIDRDCYCEDCIMACKRSD